MKHLLLAPFLLGFISPVFADSWRDIDDLKQLIESNGTKIKELNNCEENNLGHYSFSKQNDVLTICTNNINTQDPSEYWEVLAHEAAHAMQACNRNTLWQSKYHPRMLRALKSEAPYYAEILKQYRGRDKILELEAFDMELKTPSEVIDNYDYYCLRNENDVENLENPVLTDKNTSLLKDLVGGEDLYDELISWGIENLSQEEKITFDQTIDNGSFEDIKKSILNLKEIYDNSQNVTVQISDDDTYYLKNLVGGEESYNDLMSWGNDELTKKEIEAYDNIISSNNLDLIEKELLNLNNKYLNWFQKKGIIQIQKYEPYPGKLNPDPDVQVPQTNSLRQACDLYKDKEEEIENFQRITDKILDSQRARIMAGEIESNAPLPKSEQDIYSKKPNLEQQLRAILSEIHRQAGISSWKKYSAYDLEGTALKFKEIGTKVYEMKENHPDYEFNPYKNIVEFNSFRNFPNTLCDKRGYMNMLRYHAKNSSPKRIRNIKSTMSKGSMKSKYDLVYELFEEYKYSLVKNGLKNHRYPLTKNKDGVYLLECNVESYKTNEGGTFKVTDGLLTTIGGEFFGTFGDVVEKIDTTNRKWTRFSFDNDIGKYIPRYSFTAIVKYSDALGGYRATKPWFADEGETETFYKIKLKNGRLIGDQFMKWTKPDGDIAKVSTSYTGQCFNARNDLELSDEELHFK